MDQENRSNDRPNGGSRGRSGGYRDGRSGGYRGKSDGDRRRSGDGRGSYRGGRDGESRGGYKGSRDGGSRGGYKGGRDGASRGGYRSGKPGDNRGGRSGGYRGKSDGESRSGYKGKRDGGYRSDGNDRGGFRSERDGNRNDRNYQGKRDGYKGSRDGESRGYRANRSDRGDRGGFRNDRRDYKGKRDDFKGGRSDRDDRGYRGKPAEQEKPEREYTGYHGQLERRNDRGGFRGGRPGGDRGGFRGKPGDRGGARDRQGAYRSGKSVSARGNFRDAAPAPEPIDLGEPENIILVANAMTGAEEQIAVYDGGADQFAARLKKVAKERRKWAEDNQICCYRVYDADLPDFSVAIDRYDGVWKNEGESYLVIAEYQAPKEVSEEKAAARFADVMTLAPVVMGVPADHVFAKTRRHEKGGGQYTDQQKDSCVVYTDESGCIFEVDLGGYLDTGIFLDHRITRELVGRLAQGTNFLNLFAYTGTATVHAALGGALTTTTVDMSRTYLGWAERNMELNNISDPTRHRFVRYDALRWIEREIGTGNRYDLIFVDPPTFSNSKSMGDTTWSVQRDHVNLLIGVAALLTPGGKAIFSCNLRNFTPDVEALAKEGIVLKDITAQTIPHDFERNPRIHKCYVVSKVLPQQAEPQKDETQAESEEQAE